MQAHHTRTMIATARARDTLEDGELDYLDCLAQSGADEFVEDLMGRWADSYTLDGRDERMEARAMSRAGFATAFRF